MSRGAALWSCHCALRQEFSCLQKAQLGKALLGKALLGKALLGKALLGKASNVAISSSRASPVSPSC